jgi:Fe-S cluster assembly protein SufD
MIEKYIEEFNQLPAVDGPWLDQARKTSIARLEQNGFPTQRLEEWKDTNLTSITNTYFPFPVAKSKHASVTESFWKNRPHIVFHDGFCESISVKLPGVSVRKFSEAISDPQFQNIFSLKTRYDHSFLDLNTLMAREGVAILVDKNIDVLEPIYLIYHSGLMAQAYHYRNLIKMETSSKAKIVEIFMSDKTSESWSVPVTQIQTGANSAVEHIMIQDENLSSYHTGLVLGRLDAHSKLATYSFSFGGKVVRNDIHISLEGEGAECVMNGLYAVGQNQIVDHHTTVDHAKPNCSSFENYKGVLMDQAHGIFEGKIIVRENAQKTDAKQMNQNLLLSSQAKVNTAPQLEILADDVKCAHGATIGKLDEDQVFYLRSRGIDMESARQMLVMAYANEVMSKISIPEVVEEIQRKLALKIGVA